MKVGLLVIASEILDGKIADLNTRFLGNYLKRHHLELAYTMTVKDSEADIHLGLKTLSDNVDVIVTSGGLGPTKDDITKLALGNFLNRATAFSEAADQISRENYARYSRAYPGKDHGYSFLPEGFKALSNPTGMAPGFTTEFGEKILYSAPGVPKEFQSMTEAHLLKLLVGKMPKDLFFGSVTVRTKRIPEEKIFGEVDTTLWDRLEDYGSVSSLPVLFGVDIGVKISGRSLQEVTEKKNHVLSILKASPVWPSVWHEGEESLEEVLVKKALEKKVTFGFAESCTGGLCSHRITNVSGSSQVFMGSVVSYDESVKEGVLGVQSSTLKAHGAVSVEVAREMAAGLVSKLNLDFGISITGLAGPNGGTIEKPVGTVCIGVTSKGQTDAQSFQFFGDREQLKNRFSQAALMTLLESLEKLA